MATMSDFVFPHPDGLATYRIYEDIKKGSETVASDVEVMHGEAIDIAVSALSPTLLSNWMHVTG